MSVPVVPAARSAPPYGTLIGRHGRLLHQRWIEGREPGDQPLLDAPELGSAADTAALYGAVRAMRTVPIGVSALVPVAEIPGKLLRAVL